MASSSSQSCSIPDIPACVASLRNVFNSGKTRPLSWRREQLKALLRLMTENRDEVLRAAMADLGKRHEFESNASEINIVVGELKEALDHLTSWAEPESVYTPIGYQPATSHIYKQPLGVVLIISPWNYPVNLALVPLIGSIAGGNTCLLKTSRHSPTTSATLAKLLPQYMDMEALAVEHLGGAAEITQLIAEKYDHIFFTGSVSVGKVVYQAAANHLTPVTLELGGKNPVIVDSDIDIEFAAKRIAWGKWWNAGQTCIGVDYILVARSQLEPLIEAFKTVLHSFYGSNPKESESFARVISTYHVHRLAGLMKFGEVVIGGETDPATRYCAPTVMKNVKLDSELMQDEIFGPIIPLIPFDSLDEAIAFVNARPTPLALYYFGSNGKTQEEVIQRTRSGAVGVNECLMHFTNPLLPFGGCGESGLGAYHGKRTFNTFIHQRSVVKSTHRGALDLPLRYPPYTNWTYWLVDKVGKSGW